MHLKKIVYDNLKMREQTIFFCIRVLLLSYYKFFNVMVCFNKDFVSIINVKESYQK